MKARGLSRINPPLLATIPLNFSFHTSSEAKDSSSATNHPALWRVRGQSFLVRHARSAYEAAFTDSDSRISG